MIGSPNECASAINPDTLDVSQARTFVDVPEGSLFATQIRWLAAAKVTTGWDTPRGYEFRPTTPITRDAMAAFIYRMKNNYIRTM